jgi:hypothetical protein
MVKMKHFLFLLIVINLPLNLFSQRDTTNLSVSQTQKEFIKEAIDGNVTIYPVPVRDNSFTIKSNKEISLIKVTNIIGQDIFRIKYNTPQLFVKILLDDPGRGMYLVIVLFSDNTRVVKKVMIEGTN